MTRDGHIRLLPLHVANKIAAGEVVERPASVLKELLENALDAGSTRIDITVVAGGRTLISVRDNGSGMNREDALLSLERQATSKIRDVDDIEHIDTLGFRGEAIPSIASVSRFTLTTRTATQEEATHLVVNAGLLAEVATCAGPLGTCVEVRDLFCNVPARRKFLRAFATEESHIRATFTVHALAHPDVGFSLILDGRETYRLPPGATLEERIHDLFGASFAETLIPLVPSSESDARAVSLHGYIERPGSQTVVRRDQFVFVNNRPATAPAIAYALREAYPRASHEQVRPSVILFVDLPPEQVDVNVHPAKREVRFRRPADVREVILSSLARTLAPAPTPNHAPESAPTPLPSGSFSRIENPFVRPVQPRLVFPSTPAPQAPVAPPSETPECVPSAEPILRSTTPTRLWRWFQVMGQTESGYVLVETDAGLVVLDPLAAQARIVYEKLLVSSEVASQQLLIPDTITLSPADSARVRQVLSDLQAMGFGIEEFGRDTWKVDAVPHILEGLAMNDLLVSLAHDLIESGSSRGRTRLKNELIAKSVSATYAGHAKRLTNEEATRLIEDLAHTQMPYISPRGKPVLIFYSNRELARKFGS